MFRAKDPFKQQLNNGGATETVALGRDSIGIDYTSAPGCIDQNGAPLATDQRGAPRKVDGDGDGIATCDIGAFERRGTT